MCNTEQDEAVVAQREDGVLVVQQASDAFIARDAERRELGPYGSMEEAIRQADMTWNHTA